MARDGQDFTPEGWCLSLDSQWNIGYEKRSVAGGLISDQAIQIKIDLIPPNPAFQHFIIPVPHGLRLRQSLKSKGSIVN